MPEAWRAASVRECYSQSRDSILPAGHRILHVEHTPFGSSESHREAACARFFEMLPSLTVCYAHGGRLHIDHSTLVQGA